MVWAGFLRDIWDTSHKLNRSSFYSLSILDSKARATFCSSQQFHHFRLRSRLEHSHLLTRSPLRTDTAHSVEVMLSPKVCF